MCNYCMPDRVRALHDLEAQIAAANRADRDERHAAARFDRRDLVRVGGVLRDARDVPHPSDVWEAGDEL